MARFSKFANSDFDRLAGSSWRGRERLGGVLSSALSHQTGEEIQSWGVRRRMELHLACPAHYHFHDPYPAAKLFVQIVDDPTKVSDDNPKRVMRFGLYLETAGAGSPEASKFRHWRNFVERLQSSRDTPRRLLSAMTGHDLSAELYEGRALTSRFMSRDGHLFRVNGGGRRECGLGEFIAQVAELPHRKWVDFYVFSEVDESSGVAAAEAITDTITNVLLDLAPIYLEALR